MKKLSAILAVVAALSLFLLSGCTGNPERATQRDMLRHGEFFCNYTPDNDESHDFKLTINKDKTYSLYIKDYENSDGDYIVMKTFTGNWSHVFTYEYKYSVAITTVGFLSETRTAVLGIYLLEGYVWNEDNAQSQQLGYFGYEKSSGKGTLFSTDKTIDEQFLNSYRDKPAITYTELGRVELPGFVFEASK